MQTYTHTHISYTAVHVSQQTVKLQWVRVSQWEELRILKTGRRRSARGTGASANFLRHVCLSMCVLPAQAVLPCNCSKTQPIIFTQLHFFPLRPSKCSEKEWARDREQENWKEAERERRIYNYNEWMNGCFCTCICIYIRIYTLHVYEIKGLSKQKDIETYSVWRCLRNYKIKTKNKQLKQICDYLLTIVLFSIWMFLLGRK